MELFHKLKEVGTSVVPITVIVTILHFFVSPLDSGQLGSFYIGAALVIVGLALFLLGTDIGLLPIGEKIGSTVTAKKNLPLLLGTGLVVGFVITFAEPDISVLASQIASVNSSINETVLISLIGIGLGLFVCIAFLRVTFRLSLKWMFVIFYVMLFVLAIFSDPALVPVAFDSGGATTGPMATPFIMALGIGVARVQKKQEEADNFGFLALASIGPILAVLVLGIISPNSDGAIGKGMDVLYESGNFIPLFFEMAQDVIFSLMPLLFIFALYQITLVKMPAKQVGRMLVGIIYAFIGLVLFFAGAHGGFMPVGFAIGKGLSLLSSNTLIIVGILFGAVAVIAEPAVWVLVEQVENISRGHIRKPIMLTALAIGVGVSVGLSMIRIATGISIWYFLVPSYAISLLLLKNTPILFSAMAFDSGGVASGPMSSTFILSFAIGASVGQGGNPATDAFGVVAFVAMSPLVTIQLLGLLYKRKQVKIDKKGAKA
ncbi:MAG TPA: DUF1538 domain-containing protein [Sphaerochaeta sp.]|nr:DUF1538 domain-containing protein [Sphaerochaeta sp.]